MGEPVELTDDTTDVAEHDGDDTETVEDEMLVEEISIDGMCGVY
ncbi:MAG: mycofactocin precursor MftA [Actinomycetota bacterium]|nr:mycofactocin precursor MftA [Actinomycetota bacterium]